MEDKNNMSLEESIKYIRQRDTGGTLRGIINNEIKDIKFDYTGTEFILLEDGRIISQNSTILSNVKALWMQSLYNIYAITNYNEIMCISNSKSNLSKYINSNNCRYQKIVYNVLSLVGLTDEGNIRAICTYENEFGIDVSRFENVEDIKSMIDVENNIEYIMVKHMNSDKYIPLFVLEEEPSKVVDFESKI